MIFGESGAEIEKKRIKKVIGVTLKLLRHHEKKNKKNKLSESH